MPAILFDFDGVLVDSEPSHQAALRAALETVGLSFSNQDFRGRFLGCADSAIIAQVAADHHRTLSPEEHAAVRSAKWQHFQRLVVTGQVPTYHATAELLKSAQAAGPVAICSGALRQEIDLILRRLALTVPVIVSADDTPLSKPDPAPYRRVAGALGMAPHECVTIEDTAKGVRSARLAGCLVVGVCHAMTAEELSEADLVVRSTADLSVPRLLDLIASRA